MPLVGRGGDSVRLCRWSGAVEMASDFAAVTVVDIDPEMPMCGRRVPTANASDQARSTDDAVAGIPARQAEPAAAMTT
jgi:hypothetical protein